MKTNYTPNEKAWLSETLAKMFPYDKNDFFQLLGQRGYNAVRAVAALAVAEGVTDLAAYFDEGFTRRAADWASEALAEVEG